MKSLISVINKETYYKLIFFTFIFILLLVPPIQLPWFQFKFQLVDFFMPLFIGMIAVNKWYKNWNLLYVKNLLLLTGIIALSIIVNQQWMAVNDCFEIYKVLKYLLVFLFLKSFCCHRIHTIWIDVIFAFLLIFNFLHYYNIFHFNQVVMPLYCGENCIHLKFFGLNSIGQPDVKRMIGTMGNPNDNAILFLICMLFYLPKDKWKIKDICFFVLCLIAFLACQSRTSLAAFFVIIITNFFVIRLTWKKICLYSGLIIAVVLGFFFIDMSSTYSLIDISSTYSLTLLDGTAFQSYSWSYRLELWKQFLTQFLDDPIFGHAPQKNYFYENKLHFENEYLLYLWRYGILGFASFIGFYLIPVRKIFKTIRSSELSKNTLLLMIIFAICGLTNVPLSNTILSVLFFGYLGIFYSQKEDKDSEFLNKYPELQSYYYDKDLS
jgi:O-antigen ligase